MYDKIPNGGTPIVTEIMGDASTTIEEKAHKIHRYAVDLIYCSAPRGDTSYRWKLRELPKESEILNILQGEENV